jgi:uncharacterized cupin superfamily protein
MSSREPAIAKSVATCDHLAPAPIDPSWIIEGAPEARSSTLTLLPDGTIKAVIWDCTAGRFDWWYGGGDEVIHILEGEAELTSSNGATTVVRPGDVVHFASGSVVRWHVPEYVKKLALFSIYVSLPRRLAQRVPYARRVVHRVRAYRAGVLAVVLATIEIAPDPTGLF